MKNVIYRLAAAAFAVVVLSLPLAAQVATVYRAEVPFEFTVGSATMPAGHYDVREWGSGLVLLEGGGAHYYFNSIPISATAGACIQSLRGAVLLVCDQDHRFHAWNARVEGGKRTPKDPRQRCSPKPSQDPSRATLGWVVQARGE